ncbi:MAG: penicillin-binding transpeptidase domain-containing protein [Marinilabiliales bacterium]|nr:penicillin-binding transpeptidase domain-containing protein [Marinilabiliales bacterium]
MDYRGNRVRTTIDPALQKEVVELVNRHQAALEGNMIHNAAALVVEVASGHVLAYAGNSTLSDTTGRHGRDVDMIMAPRSTGSIMKPFLYAGLLSSGMMLPNALIADIPTRFQGFRPENSDFTYSGAVPAGDALARSLNIPAVRMLQMLEEERFLNQLHRMGFTTLTSLPHITVSRSSSAAARQLSGSLQEHTLPWRGSSLAIMVGGTCRWWFRQYWRQSRAAGSRGASVKK